MLRWFDTNLQSLRVLSSVTCLAHPLLLLSESSSNPLTCHPRGWLKEESLWQEGQAPALNQKCYSLLPLSRIKDPLNPYGPTLRKWERVVTELGML